MKTPNGRDDDLVLMVLATGNEARAFSSNMLVIRGCGGSATNLKKNGFFIVLKVHQNTL